MDPFSRPSTSSSLGAGSSSGAGSDHQGETSGELEHAVKSIFQYFQLVFAVFLDKWIEPFELETSPFRCPETANFNPEIVSERLSKKAGRQSKKPFSVFYERVANNREFVEKYEDIKFQKWVPQFGTILKFFGY